MRNIWIGIALVMWAMWPAMASTRKAKHPYQFNRESNLASNIRSMTRSPTLPNKNKLNDDITASIMTDLKTRNRMNSSQETLVEKNIRNGVEIVVKSVFSNNHHSANTGRVDEIKLWSDIFSELDRLGKDAEQVLNQEHVTAMQGLIDVDGL